MKVNDKVKMVYGSELFTSAIPNDDRIEVNQGSVGTIVKIHGTGVSKEGSPMVRLIEAQFPEGLAFFPDNMVKLNLVEVINQES